MALKFDTIQTLKVALASEPAANDLVANLGGGGSSAQPIATTDSPTFVGLTLTGNETVAGTLGVTGVATFTADTTFNGNAKLASGKVLKINNIQVVGAQQSAVTPVALTATTGSLPTATGAQVIADTATPTVVELLKLCVELKANIIALQAVNHAHGLTA